MVQIYLSDLEELRLKNKHKKIVFCSGGFDLTHVGHILFFEDCKMQGDILVVAVARDVSLRRRKGNNRPILNEYVRIKTIDSLKPVDYTFISPETSTTDLLHTLNVAFEKLRPDIYVINEDAFDIDQRRELCSKYEVSLKILPRYCPPEFEGVSTSKIIAKIKNLDD